MLYQELARQLKINRGIVLDFFMYVLYSTLLYLPPLRYHCVSEDTGIEPRTVAISALAVRRSSYSATSHPVEKIFILRL